MLINNIKDKFDMTWMTPSQRSIFDLITQKFTTQKVINIYGQSGTGKTFLAWNLEKHFDAIRVSNLEDAENATVVILDNYSHKKTEIRSLLQEMFFKNIDKIIVITDKKAEDDIVCLFLDFTSEDRKVFKNNLWKHFNFDFGNEKDEYNMNSLIKYNLV